LSPTIPLSAAGCRIDPPVSVPSAPNTIRAATAAAEPPELPPGLSSRFQGFRVGKNPEFSVELPIANSSMFVLPRMGVPAARRSFTAVPS
jgi:hypothetical protein